jgi:uncharacterized protein with HEPN domain
MLPEEKEKLLKYLTDALNAAIQIEMDTTGLSPKQFHFNNIKWLVERGIEIISEALKRASLIEANLPVSDLHKIYATRNRIAHEYDIVDPNVLYTISTKSIPVLIEELKNYIKKLDEAE